MTEETPLLSVVIVTYNEADRIADCLESVLTACRGVGDFEVIVVDGNSTDDTVSIACSYPVTVLRTDEDVVSTPSSGRHVGTAYASGEYTLFVDGDTEVADDWLADAIDEIDADPALAGVGGHFNDADDADRRRDVDSLWRTVLYDTEALREVGGFDPYLSSQEDIEVGYKLREAGYRLLQLPNVVGRHPDQEGVGERIRRWQQGFYYGKGEVLRKYLHSPSDLGSWLFRLRLWFGLMAWTALGAYAAMRRRGDLGLGWFATTAALLCVSLVARDRKWVQRQLISTFVLRPIGITRGLLRYPSPRPDYPLETVEIVQDADDRQITA